MQKLSPYVECFSSCRILFNMLRAFPLFLMDSPMHCRGPLHLNLTLHLVRKLSRLTVELFSIINEPTPSRFYLLVEMSYHHKLNCEYLVRNPVQATLPSNKRLKAGHFLEYFWLGMTLQPKGSRNLLEICSKSTHD